MRIALTGASGVLGYNLRMSFPEHEYFCFNGNIVDSISVNKWVSSLKEIDAMLHLAGIVAISQVEENPGYAWETNVKGTQNIMNAISGNGTLKDKMWFFFASTSQVYDLSGNNPLAEDSPIGPESLYGKQKLEAEKIVIEASQKNSLNFCVGRIFSYTSPLQSKRFVIPNLINKIKYSSLNSSFPIPGAQNIRDFLSARQVVEIILKLANLKYNGIINIASGKGTKIRDVAESVKTFLQREDVVLEFQSYSKPSTMIADTTKLNNHGIKYEISAKELIKFCAEGV